jgi:hypothetical protein
MRRLISSTSPAVASASFVATRSRKSRSEGEVNGHSSACCRGTPSRSASAVVRRVDTAATSSHCRHSSRGSTIAVAVPSLARATGSLSQVAAAACSTRCRASSL